MVITKICRTKKDFKAYCSSNYLRYCKNQLFKQYFWDLPQQFTKWYFETFFTVKDQSENNCKSVNKKISIELTIIILRVKNVMGKSVKDCNFNHHRKLNEDKGKNKICVHLSVIPLSWQSHDLNVFSL